MVERDISRREFVRLSAAAAGALLAGRGRAVQSENLTDRYAFLLSHVEADFAIPTLVRFADESGFDTLANLDVEYRTRAEEPAAYTRLPPTEAETLAQADSTDLLEYAPGSNPFWRLGVSEARLFPDPADSVDFIAFEEALAGLDALESAHDRLCVETLGSGHGHENIVVGTQQSRPVWLAELTDDVVAADERETVVFALSIHGDERAGVEAGLRFIEDVLTGERPEIAALLSSVRLVFVCPNPDGWVVRTQTYEDPVDPPDFRRHNGADRDLNREQPTAGWILPGRLPGEPRGANLAADVLGEVDDDVPEQVTAAVPETLALVRTLRSYDVDYLLDLHGMYGWTESVLAIEPGGGSPADRADTELLTGTVETRLREELGPLADWTDGFEQAIADTNEQTGGPDDCEFESICQMPAQLFGSGTGLETIGYTISGSLDVWADLPERVGGLGATSLALEVVFSNSLPDGMERRFIPEVVEFQVAAYSSVCDAAVRHAVDEVGAAVETGGRSTAYLASEDLTRRATDLPHVGDSLTAPGGTTVGNGSTALAGGVPTAGGVDSTLAVDSQQFTSGPVTTTVEVPESTHTLTVEVRAAGNRVVEATLLDTNGNAVEQRAGPADGDPVGRYTLTAVDPEAGAWRVEATVGGGPVELRTTRLVTDGIPNPIDVLGYRQRDYEVTPLAALEVLDSFADAPIEAVDADALRADALVVDGVPAYDNVLVTHSHGVDGDALSGLAAYVEAGGNLVLTDSGLILAADLDVAGLAAVERDDIGREELPAAVYPDTADEHPLVAGQRTFPSGSNITPGEPWIHSPMGYARTEVPMYTIAEGPLREAGGTIGSAADGRVRLATVPTDRDRIGVHLLGSLLPPANQNTLHPFGLLDHSLTRLGYLLLCNALGYRLSFSRNGEEVTTLGSTIDIEYGDRDSEGEGENGGGNGGDGASGASGDGASGASGDDGGDDGESGDGAGVSGDESGDGNGGADGGGPGFGPLAGVAGLGGLGYILARRGTDADSKSE